MNLTPHQQAILTTALELEIAGYEDSAKYLRKTHFPQINWDNWGSHHAFQNISWSEVLRKHNEWQPESS